MLEASLIVAGNIPFNNGLARLECHHEDATKARPRHDSNIAWQELAETTCEPRLA